MQKYLILPCLFALLLLTGCIQTNKNPADSDESTQVSNPTPDITIDRPQKPTGSSMETTGGSIDISIDTDNTTQTTPSGITDTKQEETTDATEDPEETLNKILKELHELDELMNGL